MLIGELAEKTGLSRDTIRYYEKRGLLGPRDHTRRANNYRDYSEEALQRLQGIRELKRHGFTLSEVRALLEMHESSERCEGLPGALENKLHQVDQQIEQLWAFRQRLRSALSSCGGSACEQPALAHNESELGGPVGDQPRFGTRR